MIIEIIDSLKLTHNINTDTTKILAFLSGKIDKHEYLAGEFLIRVKWNDRTSQVYFCLSFRKASERQAKILEDKGRKQVKVKILKLDVWQQLISK